MTDKNIYPRMYKDIKDIEDFDEKMKEYEKSLIYLYNSVNNFENNLRYELKLRQGVHELKEETDE